MQNLAESVRQRRCWAILAGCMLAAASQFVAAQDACYPYTATVSSGESDIKGYSAEEVCQTLIARHTPMLVNGGRHRITLTYTGLIPSGPTGFYCGFDRYAVDVNTGEFYAPESGPWSWDGVVPTGCTPPPAQGNSCGIANPAQPDTGVKIERSVDYSGAGAHPLNLERTYRSQVQAALPYGAADPWRHSYGAALTLTTDRSGVLMRASARRASGDEVIFSHIGNGTWRAYTSTRDVLTELRDATGARTGFTYQVIADDSLETYDPVGRLLSIKARNGWLTTLAYSTSATPPATAPQPGLLIGVKNQFGRELKFAYDSQGRMAELLPPGAVAGSAAGASTSPIRYAYAEPASLGAGVPLQGQLTSVTWQDGAVRRYHYEDSRFPSALTGITDEAGVRYATYAYDASGRISRTEHIGGTDRVDLSYAVSNGVPQTTVIDYAGAGGSATTRTYSFTDIGNTRYATTVTAPCPLCGTTQQASTYDASGNPTKQIAHDGTVNFFAYDAKGRETERATFPSSYGSATARPALSAATKVISTKWHATFNLPTQIAEPKKTTANTYNSKGMLTGQSWTATTDATGAAKFAAVKTGSTYATGWTYNANSLATTVIEKVDAVETKRWTATYSSKGELTKSNNVTTGKSFAVNSFNSHGKPLTATDENARALSFAYSPRGNTAKRIEPGRTYNYVRGPDNEVPQLEFDATNALAFERDANGTLKDIRLNGKTIVGNQLLARAERLPEEREWWARLLGTPTVLSARALVEFLIPSAHAQEALLPACALGPNPVCVTGVVATTCKVVIIAAGAAIIVLNRERSCTPGGGCGDRDSSDCKREREHCTEICNNARYDPDMPNIWGGSFQTCYNGCVSSRCK